MSRTNGKDSARARQAPKVSAPRHFCGVAEEAGRLGVSQSWLYTEIRSGRFPHKRLGARVLLDPIESDEFLERQAVGVEDALARAAEGH